MVGHMRKRKAEKDKGRGGSLHNGYKKTFLNSLRKMPRESQVKRDGLAITVERRGTSSGIALRHLTVPSSMSGLQRTTLEERLPSEV